MPITAAEANTFFVEYINTFIKHKRTNIKYEKIFPVKKPPMKNAKPAVNKNVSLKRTISMTFIFNFLICLNIRTIFQVTKFTRKFPNNPP